MSSIKEQQDEEREALISIYEGDAAFKELNPQTFQYKYGEEDNPKSFLLELIWGANYPEEPPEINLDLFYNRNLISSVKTRIKDTITEEAQQWLGCGMTYTLFECLKERIDELLQDQPEHSTESNLTKVVETVDKLTISSTSGPVSTKPAKKEQLTKAQKRRQWEQSDHKGERPRGYNWVDIVKHLSQTGGKDECGSVPTNYDG